MIEKARSWKGRQISQSDIKHQAILEPQFTRGIKKTGDTVSRRKIVENFDGQKKVEKQDGVHRRNNG